MPQGTRGLTASSLSRVGQPSLIALPKTPAPSLITCETLPRTAGVDEISHLPGFRPDRNEWKNLRDLRVYRLTNADARLAAKRGQGGDHRQRSYQTSGRSEDGVGRGCADDDGKTRVADNISTRLAHLFHNFGTNRVFPSPQPPLHALSSNRTCGVPGDPQEDARMCSRTDCPRQGRCTVYRGALVALSCLVVTSPRRRRCETAR